jgi:hypothetical protein
MSQNKILISVIAYREKYLEESIRSCYFSAKHPENLIFSVVSEQEVDSLHAKLDFIPKDKIVYHKYDLSEYRGVLWSRAKTIEAAASFDYDYVLYTCGHNRFVENWDEKNLELHNKLKNVCDKPVITIAGPSFVPAIDGSIKTYDKANEYRPSINSDYTPGYGFPIQVEVPKNIEYVEDVYLQFSWVFVDKKFTSEVPLDPDMNYHGEEIFTTIQAWSRGWRFYTTSNIFYYHDTEKEYEGELLPRMTTHRPWSDINKDYFWRQSDLSMLKLNKMLSGNLTDVYPDVTKEAVADYCSFSGLDSRWCEYDPNYDKLPKERHAEFFRDREPFKLEEF